MIRFGLGIDCATACGLALVSSEAGRESLLDHWTVDLADLRCPTAETVRGVFSRAQRKATLGGLVVSIELPYLGKNAGVLKTLARFCGRFEQQADSHGCVVYLTTASSWQAGVLGRFGGKKRADKKKAAVLWAMAMFGQTLTEDEADAAGQIVHVLRATGFAAKVRAAGDCAKVVA